jgi:SAM-dependent methyltransferase
MAIRSEGGGMNIPAEGLKIQLGCGRHTLSGWFCVDAAQHPQASRPVDLLSDVKAIPLPDGCASELMAIHLFEHLYRWECDDVIEEWRRILRPGGTLIMEMPDMLKWARNILDGREGRHPGQMSLWAAYGDPRTRDPLMVHKWGWTYTSKDSTCGMQRFLKEHGFTDIAEEDTKWHPIGRGVRDFRVTARKS